MPDRRLLCCLLLWLAPASAAGELRDGFGLDPPPHHLRVHSRLEALLDLPTDVTDPLDPDELAVDATVATPSRTIVLPCYLDVPYTSRLERGADGVLREVLTPAGPPRWKLRFTPVEKGRHRIQVTARRGGRSVHSRPVELDASGPRTPGYVRLDPDSHFPYREPAEPRPVLGTNLCWAGPAGTFDYDTWLTRMAGSRIDYIRLWLDSPNRTFDLQRDDNGWDFRGVWRLETVLNRASLQGLNAVLNVGLTSGLSEAATRQRLRYLLARFSGFTNLSAFELVAREPVASPELIARLRVAAGYLRAHDPASRLLCASVVGAEQAALLAGQEVVDFVTVELPSPPDLPEAVGRMAAAMPRATMISGYGYADRERELADRQGLRLHDGLWAGVLGGAIGGAMPWWWDAQVHRRYLYPRFRAVATFADQIAWRHLAPFDGCRLDGTGWRVQALASEEQVVAWVHPTPQANARPTVLEVRAAATPGRIVAYDPWTEQWQDLSAPAVAGVVRVPVPVTQRDLIIRLALHARRR